MGKTCLDLFRLVWRVLQAIRERQRPHEIPLTTICFLSFTADSRRSLLVEGEVPEVTSEEARLFDLHQGAANKLRSRENEAIKRKRNPFNKI